MEFSTFDGNWKYGNCAVYNHGGFWWNNCGYQNINGPYVVNMGDLVRDRNEHIQWGNWNKNLIKTTKLVFRLAA